MSKHHAVEDEPQSSDMSWIRGLAKPAAPSREVGSEPAYYEALVARAPRHAAPSDDPADAAETDAAQDIPAAARTAPLRRISAEQIDTLIGHLDAVEELPITPDDPSDLGLALLGLPLEDDEGADDEEAGAAPDHPGAQRSDTSIAAATAVSTAVPITAPTTVPTAVPTRRGRLRKPMLATAAAALCLLTVGGGTVTAMDKTVAIVVDGRTEKVTTLSNSVAGALSAAGITLTSHDTLAPGLNATISDGSTIVLDRGRLMTLTIDGKSTQIWTTARTATEALAELGATTPDPKLSANRSRSIPPARTAVTGPTLHSVGVSVAGAAVAHSTTTAKTVGQLLAADKITLGPLDRVSPAVATPLRDGLIITVDRVAVTRRSVSVPLPQPASRTVDDPKIVKGTSAVVQHGRPGRQLITYTVTSVNGKQIAKTESGRRTVTEPVGTITHVGTKSSFTYVGSEVFTNDTSFGVNWDGLAMCESTHNPQAINADPVAGLPTYGLFQFDLPTWESVGGSGNPIDASPEEQLMRAKLLYQQRGLEPWACRDSAR